MRYTTVVTLLLLLAQIAHAALPSSPHREPLPVPGPCDVVIDPTTPVSTIRTLLNDPHKRVFCVRPGDYRGAGQLLVWPSGTPSARRFLRFDGSPDVKAVQRSERAIFESIHLFGSWWVVQGISIIPRHPDSGWFFAIRAGDHNIVDGVLVDGIEHPNRTNNTGVMVQGYEGDPATHNSIQASVVRNGNQTGLAEDYNGVMIREGLRPGENNDFNKVVDNEIYDWGDGVTVSGHRNDCQEAGMQHGTLIDGNDIYLTAAKRVNCASGAPDPQGQCTCAENGIDVKAEPGPEPENWTRITNNRVWGFRPTSRAVSCGASGANGQAITAGNACPGHVLVARNVVMDSTQGVVMGGRGWIVAGNVFHEVRSSDGRGPYGTLAIFPASFSSDVRVQFNTVVGVDNAYDDVSSDTDTRCNVVIDDEAQLGTAGFRGANHVTAHNFLYHSPVASMTGPTTTVLPTPAHSGNEDLCFYRKRWTGPERVCIPFAATTARSPHRTAPATGACDASITEPFAVGAVSYMTAPEPGGAAVAAAALAALGARARRRARSD